MPASLHTGVTASLGLRCLPDDTPLAVDSVHALDLSHCSPVASSLPALSCLVPETWSLALERPFLIFTLPPGDICQHSGDVCGHRSRGGAVQRPATCGAAPQRSAAPRVRTPGLEAADLQVRRLGQVFAVSAGGQPGRSACDPSPGASALPLLTPKSPGALLQPREIPGP